jgi:hypothetical protein
MIKSKRGKRAQKAAVSPELSEKRYEAVVKNYACLFCKKAYYFESIEESKCACGSQWFEKVQGLSARKISAV